MPSHRPNGIALHACALMSGEGRVCVPGRHFFTFADVQILPTIMRMRFLGLFLGHDCTSGGLERTL